MIGANPALPACRVEGMFIGVRMFRDLHGARGSSLGLAALLLAVAGCGGGGTAAPAVPVADSLPPAVPDADPAAPAPEPAVPSAATAPLKLSAWGVLHSDGRSVTLGAGVQPFALNTPLFSDYAHKLRTLSLPEGASIRYTASGPLQFPVGAVLTKSFYYPRAQAAAAGAIGAVQVLQVDGGERVDLGLNRMLETRLMVMEPTGRWGAVTYVWDDDQKDATLHRTGRTMAVEMVDAQGVRQSFSYEVPDDASCIACHATAGSAAGFQAIGPQAHNLNRDYAYASGNINQLERLAALNLLSGYSAPAPRLAVWNDAAGATLDARARAYLEVNCASCHSPGARAGHTGLWLDTTQSNAIRLGICKSPVGGQQHGRFTYDIEPGNAQASFLHFRMSNYRLNSAPPTVAMPEIGRHVFDQEGNALIRDWIDAMPATCGN
jgi:uncharacterized repeat protein (TIGR03806 family)